MVSPQFGLRGIEIAKCIDVMRTSQFISEGI